MKVLATVVVMALAAAIVGVPWWSSEGEDKEMPSNGSRTRENVKRPTQVSTEDRDPKSLNALATYSLV